MSRTSMALSRFDDRAEIISPAREKSKASHLKLLLRQGNWSGRPLGQPAHNAPLFFLRVWHTLPRANARNRFRLWTSQADGANLRALVSAAEIKDEPLTARPDTKLRPGGHS